MTYNVCIELNNIYGLRCIVHHHNNVLPNLPIIILYRRMRFECTNIVYDTTYAICFQRTITSTI